MLGALRLEEIRPIREIIYDRLKEAILSGEIGDGERLIESDIAERLNVSRTPVREAFRMLESDGILEALPRRGVVVRNMAVDDIVEIYRIRQALEVMAVQSATGRIRPAEIAEARMHLNYAEQNLARHDYDSFYADNERFTNVLVRASRMPRTIQLIGTYREQLARFRRITLSSDSRRSVVVGEHRAILDAVESRDAKLAGSLVHAHLDAALAVCVEFFTQERSDV